MVGLFALARSGIEIKNHDVSWKWRQGHEWNLSRASTEGHWKCISPIHVRVVQYKIVFIRAPYNFWYHSFSKVNNSKQFESFFSSYRTLFANFNRLPIQDVFFWKMHAPKWCSANDKRRSCQECDDDAFRFCIGDTTLSFSLVPSFKLVLPCLWYSYKSQEALQQAYNTRNCPLSNPLSYQTNQMFFDVFQFLSRQAQAFHHCWVLVQFRMATNDWHLRPKRSVYQMSPW